MSIAREKNHLNVVLGDHLPALLLVQWPMHFEAKGGVAFNSAYTIVNGISVEDIALEPFDTCVTEILQFDIPPQ